MRQSRRREPRQAEAEQPRGCSARRARTAGRERDEAGESCANSRRGDRAAGRTEGKEKRGPRETLLK